MLYHVDPVALRSTVVSADCPEGFDPSDWRNQIDARDRINLICLPSYIASVVYPDVAMAKDRLGRLAEDFPEFYETLIKSVQKRHRAMGGWCGETKA